MNHDFTLLQIIKHVNKQMTIITKDECLSSCFYNEIIFQTNANLSYRLMRNLLNQGKDRAIIQVTYYY